MRREGGGVELCCRQCSAVVCLGWRRRRSGLVKRTHLPAVLSVPEKTGCGKRSLCSSQPVCGAMRHSDSRATTAMNRVRGLGSRFVHFAAVSVVGREGSPTEGGARNVQSSAPPFHTV